MQREARAMPSAGRRIACALLAAWALSAAAGATVARAASAEPSGPSGERRAATFRGLSLTTALQLLQAEGLPVFFSTNLVHDSMRVEAEPRGGSPREILDEILRSHGLRAEEVGGRWVVVAGPPARKAFQGRVLVRGGAQPLAGARVSITGPGAGA